MRFRVIEYSSFYAVRDTETGKEHVLGDGVDTLTDKFDRIMKPGSEYFRLTWEKSLNATPNETLEAYFPEK
jgi:hypothetical protein